MERDTDRSVNLAGLSRPQRPPRSELRIQNWGSEPPSVVSSDGGAPQRVTAGQFGKQDDRRPRRALPDPEYQQPPLPPQQQQPQPQHQMYWPLPPQEPEPNLFTPPPRSASAESHTAPGMPQQQVIAMDEPGMMDFARPDRTGASTSRYPDRMARHSTTGSAFGYYRLFWDGVTAMKSRRPLSSESAQSLSSFEHDLVPPPRTGETYVAFICERERIHPSRVTLWVNVSRIPNHEDLRRLDPAETVRRGPCGASPNNPFLVTVKSVKDIAGDYDRDAIRDPLPVSVGGKMSKAMKNLGDSLTRAKTKKETARLKRNGSMEELALRMAQRRLEDGRVVGGGVGRGDERDAFASAMPMDERWY